MKRSQAIRRRATYGIVAAILATSLLNLSQQSLVSSGAENVFRWTIWLFTVFEIVLFTALAAFAENARTVPGKYVAMAGALVAAVNIMSGEVYELLRWLLPTTQFPFHFVVTTSMATFSVAFGVIWLEGTLDDERGTPALIKLGTLLLPLYLLAVSNQQLLGSLTTVALLGPLFMVSSFAAFRCVVQIRNRDDPAGVETELGLELVWLSLLWRIALAVMASFSAAFLWKADIYWAAGLSTAMGLLVIPAALGASRVSEQIVREARPAFARAGMLWWGASALWIAQLGWMYLIGPSIGSFVPAAAALLVEMVAWHYYNQALGEWARNEKSDRASLSLPTSGPIFVAGPTLAAAFFTAWLARPYTVWVVAVGGLFASVAAFLLIDATRAALRDVRMATYFEED